MSPNALPAFFSYCSCETNKCPNQILWINKDNLYYQEKEAHGCIPIASFTPDDIGYIFNTSIRAAMHAASR